MIFLPDKIKTKKSLERSKTPHETLIEITRSFRLKKENTPTDLCKTKRYWAVKRRRNAIDNGAP